MMYTAMRPEFNLNVNVGFSPNPMGRGPSPFGGECRNLYGGPCFSPMGQQPCNPFLMQQRMMMQERLMAALTMGGLAGFQQGLSGMPSQCNMAAFQQQQAMMQQQQQQACQGGPQQQPYGGDDPQGGERFRDPAPVYNGEVRPGPAFLPDPKATPFEQFQGMKQWSKDNGGQAGINPNSTYEQDKDSEHQYSDMLSQQTGMIKGELKNCTPEQQKTMDGIRAEVKRSADEAQQNGQPMSHEQQLQLKNELVMHDASAGKLPASLGNRCHELQQMLSMSGQMAANADLKAGLVPPADCRAFAQTSIFR